MYTCANCTVLACANNEPEKMPKNCPMRNASVMEAARAGYDLPENHDFYVNCSAIEGLGYCQWPRLKETVEFCKRMGYHKLGLAFCKGLRKEARIVADLLRAQGFEVVSVICKTGGISKEEVGIPEEVKIHPGEFEAMCNPIAQGMGADPRAVLMACVIGGSCAYATPIGMPANTMVVSAGGYTFKDYAKAGLPLILIATVVSMVILPIAFPFFPQ